MTSFTVHQSLSYRGTNGKDGQAGLKPVLKESIGHPLLSISHLGTKGRDGQAGLKAVLMESIGHILLSISPRGTKLMSWTSRIGSMKRVHRTSFTVHSSHSYIGRNGRDGQTVLKTVLKKSIGHPLLSISSLGGKGKGWTSRIRGSVKGVHRTSISVY